MEDSGSPKFETLGWPRQVLAVVFVVVAAWYLVWRLGSFNHQALAFSLVLYGAEVYGFITVLLHLFMTWRLTERVPPALTDEPLVDVLLTTVNEPVDMVRNSLLAAIHIDYPNKQVWLLDDGDRREMRALAAELGVNYLARGERTHAKAGNLNFALQYCEGDLVAVFDADHAPNVHFLRRTVPYFKDPDVAFVQTPQDFFNLDSFQHRGFERRSVWSEQSLFFRVIQRGKDYWNAAFFCGSCAVIRRSVLNAVGGFAVETVTEDLHTSLRIHKLGYKSVYHAEPLAYGLAPTNVEPFLKQRVRWGKGAMQVWRREGFLSASGLTWPQRLNYFASALTYFDGWQKGIFYFAPVIVLATGVMPISALNAEFLWHFIPYYLLSFWLFEEVGRGYGRTPYIEQYNMGRFAVFAWSTLIGWFSRRSHFEVTYKAVQPKRNRWGYIAPQILVAGGNLLAIPIGIWLYFNVQHLPPGALVANIVWAGLNLSLGGALLRFTLLQPPNRRAEYRFPVPLPAEIERADKQRFFATVDNISSDGCQLYGAMPAGLAPGTRVSGVIVLPTGRQPFKGEIASIVSGRSSNVRFIKSVGCRFLWDSQTDRDKLKRFLYGSDLQWHLLQLSDRARTPMEWMTQLFRDGRGTPRFEPRHWAAVRYRQLGFLPDRGSLGLVSIPARDDEARGFITFEALDTGTELEARMLTRMRQQVVLVRLGQGRRIDSPIAPVYIYPILEYRRREPWRTGFYEAASSA